MGISSLPAAVSSPPTYQTIGFVTGGNDGSAATSGSVNMGTVQGIMDADTLVALGVISPGDKNGLQLCTTLASDNLSGASSLSIAVSQQVSSTVSSDGNDDISANQQVSIQASSEQGAGQVYEVHVLTAEGHPIELLYQSYVGPDGKPYCRVGLENLDPAGVIQDVVKASAWSKLTAGDVVFASRQAYAQILQLLTALPLPSENQNEQTVTINASSSERITSTGSGAGSLPAKTDEAGAADSQQQQATTLYQLLQSDTATDGTHPVAVFCTPAK